MRRALVLACAAWAGACAPTSRSDLPEVTGVVRQASSQLLELPLAPPVTTAGEFDGAQFGSALAAYVSAAGTFLVVGAPNYDGGSGAVFILEVQRSASVAVKLRRKLDAPGGGYFGTALAVGDFNGDALPDLAVGAPGSFNTAVNQSGIVYVYPAVLDGGVVGTQPMPFYGSLYSGLGSSLALFPYTTKGALVAGEANTGHSLVFTSDMAGPAEVGGNGGLAVLDVTGDGLTDIVVGSPSNSQLLTWDAMGSFIGGWTIAENQTGLGASVIGIGDPNGNGSLDVLAGATAGNGAVHFYDGNTLKVGQSWSGIGIKGAMLGTGFGQAMASAGAFNGPDRKVVVGAPAENMNGAIHVYSMQEFPLFIEAWPGGVAGKAPNARFGSAIVGELDLDGDGYLDFAVGAPGLNASTGEVELFFGSAPQQCVTPCPECQACVFGACVPKPDDTLCTAPDYCTAVAKCGGGLCKQATPTCVTSACDANRARCVMGPVWLFDEGERHGLAGNAYNYNPPQNTLHVQGGTLPLSFYTCDGGPPGFNVDGGVVSWTPTTPGDVSICLGVIDSAAFGDFFTYPVTVSPPLKASFKVMPSEGPVPLQVTVTPDAPDSTQEWTWDFGDSSPLGHGLPQTHVYLMPGTYPVDDVVSVAGFDVADKARQFVTVVDSAGNKPPHAQISYDSGALKCEPCTQGTAPIDTIVWDFDDGSTATGPIVPRMFTPGAHRVRVTVTDINGLNGVDAMMVSVGSSGVQPPSCRLSAVPPAGNAPVTVQWKVSRPSTVDVVRLPTTPQTYADLGRHREDLEVVADGGLSCHDFAFATALSENGSAIVFTSQPTTTLKCGEAFQYTPMVTGVRPVTFTLQGPAGATLQNGTLSWTAPQVPGSYRFDLAAQNVAGRTMQSFIINVSCDGIVLQPDGGPGMTLDFQTQPCGCEAGAGSLLVFGALATLRRRRRGKPPGA